MKSVQKLFYAGLLAMGMTSCTDNVVQKDVKEENGKLVIHRGGFTGDDWHKTATFYLVDSADQKTAGAMQMQALTIKPPGKGQIGFASLEFGQNKLQVNDKETYNKLLDIFKKYNPADTTILDGKKIYINSYDAE